MPSYPYLNGVESLMVILLNTYFPLYNGDMRILEEDFVKVAETKDIQALQMMAVDVDGEKVCLSNVNGQYYDVRYKVILVAALNFMITRYLEKINFVPRITPFLISSVI
jgi:hypothetical protein